MRLDPPCLVAFELALSKHLVTLVLQPLASADVRQVDDEAAFHDLATQILDQAGGLRDALTNAAQERAKREFFSAESERCQRVLVQPAAHDQVSAAEGLEHRSTIGLVGAEMASVPGVAELCEFVADRGGRASPSSLKADVITHRLARALGRSANQSVTIAPEAGSERMRRVINKNLTEPEILRAAERVVGGGVEALKLYVMVGLPTETPADVDGIKRYITEHCA